MELIADALNALARAGAADVTVQAALANILVREGRYFDALAAYRSVAAADPSLASAHLAASELAYILRDEETGDHERATALALNRVYPDPMPVGERLPVLLLLRDAPYGMNAPLELLLDRSRVALHKYYVAGPSSTLPKYACAVAAFGFAADRSAEAASAFLRAHPGAFINDPNRFALLARDALAETLAGIPGIHAVRAERVDRERLAVGESPVLVRPADTHAGEGLALIDSAREMASHVERFPAPVYHVAPFINFASADGFFRKIRIIFVDGVAYPYHLAVSPRWMVHYLSSPMREYEWMRAEEAAFLERPSRTIPAWDAIMPAIARAIGLDYFGIDAAMLADGTLLIFEADSAMLVHDEEPDDVFAFKRPYVARIREAFHAMLEGRARR